MMLPDALTLATEKVFRSSKPDELIDKKGPFTQEQLGFEDWEPHRPEPVPRKMTLEDCGCGPESLTKKGAK